jgi:hypothetical protein
VALPARALGRAVENLVDLSRHDEVILVRSFYFLRLQADRRIAPAKTDVRMMAFGLSEFTDLLDKGPGFAKVAEPESPLDTMSVVAKPLVPAGASFFWTMFERIFVRPWRSPARAARDFSGSKGEPVTGGLVRHRRLRNGGTFIIKPRGASASADALFVPRRAAI